MRWSSRSTTACTVVVIPDHRAPVVTHMVWYRVGSADESAGQSGIAHFLEHLMFKGTEKHPAGAFSQRVAAIGGEENAFTSSDYTAYFQRVAKENLGEMMEFEADRMTNLVLTDEVVAHRARRRPERAPRPRRERIPTPLLGEALQRASIGTTPMAARSSAGSTRSRRWTGRRRSTFYKRYYTPNNAILVVAGDVTPDEVRSLAEDTYGKIAARPEAVRAPRPERAAGGRQRPPSPCATRRSASRRSSRPIVVPSVMTAEARRGGGADRPRRDSRRRLHQPLL